MFSLSLCAFPTKERQKEKMTCDRSPQLESNQRHHSYRVCLSRTPHDSVFTSCLHSKSLILCCLVLQLSDLCGRQKRLHGSHLFLLTFTISLTFLFIFLFLRVCVCVSCSCVRLVCASRRASAGAAGAVPEEAAAVLYCL